MKFFFEKRRRRQRTIRGNQGGYIYNILVSIYIVVEGIILKKLKIYT